MFDRLKKICMPMIRNLNPLKRSMMAIEKPGNIHNIWERPGAEKFSKGIAGIHLPTGGKKQMVQSQGRNTPGAGLWWNTPGAGPQRNTAWVSRITEMKYSLNISRSVNMKGL